ncbi:M48 family metallopeptidase [Candidatus Woesearchaeota archaeon]|nr:M48 family metallopeptidase [Candidatus Woesearchaeota archaeon]
MAKLYDAISSNKRNSVVLVIAFIIIALGLSYFLGFFFANAFVGLIFGIIFIIIMMLIGFYGGDSLILSMHHAKEVSKKEDPYLVNTIEGLSLAAGIPVPKIYIIKENSPNAFATGRDPQHASITVTSGLREIMDRQELEGVIAHEMSHIKNFDIRYMMLVTILAGVVVLISDFILRSFLWGGARSHDRKSGGIGIALILIGLLLAILSPIVAQLIKLAASRQREYLADVSGTMLTRNPQGLANALKKIRDAKDKIVDDANKATAHLFIENPLRGLGGMNELFSTHPDINSRIKRLEEM